MYRPVFLEGDEAPVPPPSSATVLASEARELFYSWAGEGRLRRDGGPSGVVVPDERDQAHRAWEHWHGARFPSGEQHALVLAQGSDHCATPEDLCCRTIHVPIADDSKKRLVVRHPGTGRLMWASRLPFGYIESPRLFCALTEAVIARLRKQAAGRGIHFYVFVDDVLVIGDDEGLTREGMSMLEAEFAARGLQWAPHKKRGPCRCIEFLGLLMCNVEGLRGITITKKRRAKLIAEMEMWMAREPEEGELKADPRELASFLGKLVFVSQVVAGGRTYMQGMLTQFKGLLVDWQRGQVRPSGGGWRELSISAAFWRDLRWWRGHLDSRSLAPLGGSRGVIARVHARRTSSADQLARTTRHREGVHCGRRAAEGEDSPCGNG